MTDPREELQALRRLADLEAKASGGADFSNAQSGLKPSEAGPQNSAFYNRGFSPVAQFMGGALDGLQHHVANIPVAIAQAGANTGSWIAEQLGIPKSPDNFADRVNAFVRDRDANYQQRTDESHASRAGSFGGAAAGEVLPWMIGMGELRGAGMLPRVTATGGKGLLQKGGLLAAEGGAMGFAQPVLGEGSYGEQKAKQVRIGAAAAPLTAGTVSAVGKGARYLTPSGRDAIAAERLAREYGATPEVLAALRRESGVPGFTLTADQALKTPEAVQAGRAFRNGVGGVEFARRESQNNKALRDAAQKLAGSDDDMSAALLARREQAGNFWKENLPLGAENGRFGKASNFLRDHLQGGRRSAADHEALDTARRILARVQNGKLDQAEASAMLSEIQPQSRTAQKAWDQMQGILNNGMVNPNRLVKQLETLSKSGNSVISGAADDAMRTLQKNMDGEGFVHARALDDIRQNIGSMLAKNAPNGAVGSQEAAAYGPLKAKIANQIDRAVPGYRNSLASYARLSHPINDMEAGRALLNAIDSGGRDAGGNQAVSLNAIKQMLARDNKARYPMSQEARKQAEAMLEAV